MEIDEIVKHIGKKISTPQGQQLLAGLQIGVLMENYKLQIYPRAISLICWSNSGEKYIHCAVDCKI